MEITVTRVDGALAVYPAPDYLTNYLQYSHRGFGFQGYRKVTTYEKKELYSSSEDGGIVTFSGFYTKIQELIARNNDTLKEVDLRTPVANPDIEAINGINWEGIGSTGLRDYQIEPVVDFLYKAKETNGLAIAAGGFGKTILMATTYAAYGHLGNTLVVTPLKTVFEQTHDKFTKLFPGRHIGRVGDGYFDLSNDITVTTFSSLKRCALEKCKLLLVDEVQGTTGEAILGTLSSMTPVRMLGYTATDKNLFSGADKVIKGLFGERLIYIPYQEAEEHGAVVPCVVYMVRVPMQARFSAGTFDGKLLKGIKRNEVRNALIGEVCRSVPKDWQTMIFVDHIADHLIPLYKYMPQNSTYVHRGSDKQFGAFALSAKKQASNLLDFRDKKYQFMTITDCGRSGLDVVDVKVVIQASGGTSEIEILQEAYRAARTAPGKTHAVIVDFLDEHDTALENMSLKRMDIYRKQGWKVVTVDSVKDIQFDNIDFSKTKL